MVDSKLSALYYSPRGYWKGLAAIEKLASAAKVTEQQAKDWLKRQAIWQIYLPAPRRVPRPKFDVAVPNEVHQADLLFLPHDRVGRKPSATFSRLWMWPRATKKLARLLQRSPMAWLGFTSGAR